GTFLADDAVARGMADEISSYRDVIAKLSTENTNNINGVPKMGVKANRDKKNFSLKASGRASDEELDKQGADDIEDDRQSADEDEKDLDAEDDDLAEDDDDDKLDESAEDDDFEDEKKDDEEEEESPAA
ncbi:hypothetical protein, partial [Gilliamella sp. wkB72]|uniref:hypothetical protein n=1 Tax=Gilliamella sp. wkB72 TaxID=3120265 RepID=UPI00159F222D